MKRTYFCIPVCLLFFQQTTAQIQENTNNGGWVSLGVRSTLNSFSHDGSGLGVGGQLRIQLSNRVNTDWFADYIVTGHDNVRSEYYHVGWSVLFYPFKELKYPTHTFQPYIVAGHCFDYNKKTIISEPEISDSRWGYAVQAGLGTHINLSERFDVSLTSQYMIHLTSELEAVQNGGHAGHEGHDHGGQEVEYSIEESHHNSAMEGHLLTTVSLNYKLFKLWKRS